MSLLRGAKLGPYEVVSPLGAGGMGEVYRARDTRLERDVAIKVLPQQLSGNELSRARFEREAKAIAALSHPNILAVYDVGHQDGIAYVVTELLDGGTLRQLLEDGAIGRRRALEIAIAISDGLAAAHARGIVHRDLKPENIFITSDGVVKILDFGLARVEDPSQPTQQHAAHTPTVTLYTTPGTVLGTVNYMSPEQIRAQHTDGRSDVFSFGCVLYEMLSGERAFQGETSADTMTAILREAPQSIGSRRRDVGPDVERVIERCLEKKPEARFQSSHDLSFTLRSILADSGSAMAREPLQSARRIWWAVGFAVATVLVAYLIVLWMPFHQPRLDPRPVINSLAVLPLENVSRDPEQEYFVDGMTEALISDLAKVSGLKVISRTSAMRYKGTNKSLPEIARELNVAAVVEGSVQRVGERVRITAQLIHAATDEHLWSESYDRDMGDILQLQSEVARTIAEEIRGTLTPQEQARMAGEKKINPEAYQAYLKGRFYWNKRTADGIQKAIEYFQRAVSLEPEWAMGYSGVGDTYALAPWYTSVSPDEAIPKAKAAARRALELNDALGEAHATLAVVMTDHDWNWSAAEKEFQEALRLSPNYATGYQWYSLYLRYVGRLPEALAAVAKAQELDPLSLIIAVNVGQVYTYLGEYAKAVASYSKALELDPNFALLHLNMAAPLLLAGKPQEALAAAKKASQLTNQAPMEAATLAHVCARAGQPEEARRILAELTATSAQRYVAPSHLALICAGLGDLDSMFDWLEKAYQQHDVLLPITVTDPLLTDLRSDPRFGDLLGRMGLRQPSTTMQENSPKQRVPGKIMLAVLPFENLSRDPEQEFFSDGLTEEMIAQLGRINPQKLGVIARSSAMHYKNTNRTIEQVKKELGVDYVVEGSVRRADNRVRITATLVQGRDQAQLWSESFERELKDVLSLQSEVAGAIAKEIKVMLAPQEQARMGDARPINPAAHEAYLKGRFHWNTRTPDGLKKSVEYFEKAISLDPGWALAHAGLADAYLLMPANSLLAPSEAILRARASAANALKMNKSLGEAHATLGLIALYNDWNWAAAGREFEDALDLSPNYATAHHWYGRYLMFAGRHGAAMREFRMAHELDPLSMVISVSVALAPYYAEHFEQAETELRKAIDFDPDFEIAHAFLARTLVMEDRIAEATIEAREAVRLSDDYYNAALLGYVSAKGGRPDEARRILDDFAAQSKGSYVAPSLTALVHAGLGEQDRMFEWLEKAVQDRDVLLVQTLADPLLTEVRGNPRFVDLVRGVGLPPLEQIPTAPSSRSGSPGGIP